MTPAPEPDPLVKLLVTIGELLDMSDEPRWGRRMRQLAATAEQAVPTSRRSLVSEVLALFSGMGSFNDLVLQDRHGVLPQQGEFDRLRSELFQQARAELH
jgi:hypothetical protein